MLIIGLSGKSGSGKDTSYRLLREELDRLGYKHIRLSFANKLKDICVLMFGWDRERLEYDVDYKEGDTLDDGSPDPACELIGKNRRQIMQEIGTEAMRNGLHHDIWIIVLKLAIMRGEYRDYDVGFITDTRFMNELNFIQEMGGKTTLIKRDSERDTLTNHSEHISEQEWQQFTNWDIVIDNTIRDHLSIEENEEVLRGKLRTQIIPVINKELQ